MHAVLIRLTLVALTVGMAAPAPAASDPVPLRLDARFSGFDAIAHIRRTQPDLAGQAEAISHWAGFYSVNPVLLGQLARELAAPGPDAIHELARSLAQAARPDPEYRTEALDDAAPVTRTLAQQLGLSPASVEAALSATRAEMTAAGLWRVHAVTADTPPLLDLPFAAPLRWQFNGAHSFTGDDGEGIPLSSIDFTSSWQQRWGDNTSAAVVTAAHDGEITVYSECFVQVQHANGWGTRYYHLDEVPVVTGAQVRAGDRLGIYANNRLQALCSGGHSTGPHVHFSLVRDGDYASLEDVALSGFTIHPGEESYDSHPERMWLEKRGARHFAYGPAIGPATGDNLIDYRYNGMWYAPAHTGHGLNIEITEFPAAGEPRKAVFIVLYTYDDSGAANFYVGNRDFERWRSDESLAIDLLQTAGGDLTQLSPIDFDNPDHVRPAGRAEILFENCNTVLVDLQLDERSSGQSAEHTLELVRLIGVPTHVCEAASLPLPATGN